MAKENVLVVEVGRDGLLEKIEAVIGKRHHIATAASTEKATQLITKQRFDLLIAEIRPPDLAGLSLAEAVRRRDPAIAIVLLGDPRSIDAASARLKMGPQALLSRRCTATELERAIDDALERRRLLRDNKRLKALLPLLEISKTMMSEVDLGKLFDVILEIIWKETEADSVSLMLLDEAEQELTVKAALDPWGKLKQGRERVGEGIAGWVAKTAEPLMLTEESPANHPLRGEMEEMGASSVLCLPLVAKGRVIGVLRSSKRGGSPFTQSDQELLSILCGQAAIAIENARLFTRVKNQQARVEQLLKQTVAAQEHERKRVSVDIHDGAAQWLVSALYRIQACDRILDRADVSQSRMELSEIKGVIDQSIKELRRVIYDLQPPALGELGLLGVLRQNVHNFERETGIACSFQVEGTPVTVPPLYDLALYRIAQEALANARKHSQATKVDVSLSFHRDELHLEIRDNGKGFDLSHALNNARSAGRLGLLGMKDRAETLGGSMTIETSQGAGTSIALILPLYGASPEELSPIAEMTRL